MTIKAIELLNDTSKPFFLMVEGSQIDWAGHDNDPLYLAHEVIEFEKAVRFAKELAEQLDDLQVLVTADHETGGLTVDSFSFTTEVPLDTDSYEIQQEKRTNRSQEISVSWSTGGHTKTKVILAGMGPFTEDILSAEHHIDTFSIMRQAVDGQTEPYGGMDYNKGFLPTYAWILIFLSPAILSISLAFILTKVIRMKKK
jgi:alkaline phosphatase